MTFSLPRWSTIHPAVYGRATALHGEAALIPRPHGAVRFECPVHRTLVLVTDDEVLGGLRRKRARLRCPACKEMHLVTRQPDAAGSAIVATAGES